jgi:ankyrin repeat protein
MYPFKKKITRNLNAEFLQSYKADIADIQELLDAGADLNAKDDKGRNILDILTSYETQPLPDNIAFFLDKGLRFAEKEGFQVALYHCLNNPKTFARLLAMGANINKLYDSTEQTVLHHAILNENIDAVHMLLKYHARTDVKNKNDETPVELALSLFQSTQKPCYEEMLAALNTESKSIAKEDISFTTKITELNLRITTNFNFASGVCREFTFLNDAKMPSTTTVIPFETLEGTKFFNDAEAEFIKQGGKAFEFKRRLDKR